MQDGVAEGDLHTVPEAGEYTGEQQEGASDSNDYEELKASNKPHGRQYV